MKKIATWLVALVVLVLACFALKFAVHILVGTLIRTVGIALIVGLGALVVLGGGATALLRKR